MYSKLLELILKWCNINPENIKDGTIAGYIPPPLLKYIPEHWITDYFEYHFFFLRIREKYAKDLCSQGHVVTLLTFTSVALTDIEVISNPYARAKLVELVSFCCYNNQDIIPIFNSHQVAINHLTRGLIKFYIEIEFTGASHQFYAKYEYRHYAANIFKKLWRLPRYQQAFVALSKSDLFERFVNMIMNDTTYSMDEGLDKLFKVMEFEVKKTQGQILSPEEEKSHEQYQNVCRSVFSQARQNLKIMANISSWAPHAFFFGDFRTRLSGMLNLYLTQMVSPKIINLNAGKKGSKDDMKFKPKSLLRDLLKIYINLCADVEFCKAVTQDERSYNHEEMKKALRKVEKDNTLSEDKLNKFDNFLKRIQEISKENEDVAAKLGDIPDEFLCQITYTLMKDPVQLPSSQAIMERSAIKQHLLNDEHDPFNRAPLKISQVKDLPELKKKIEDWVHKKLSGEIMEIEKPKPQAGKARKETMDEEVKMVDENDEEEYDPFRWTGKNKFK
jgi:ubiquitin conjugation factor E4 B